MTYWRALEQGGVRRSSLPCQPTLPSCLLSPVLVQPAREPAANPAAREASSSSSNAPPPGSGQYQRRGRDVEAGADRNSVRATCPEGGSTPATSRSSPEPNSESDAA